jgi:hypothetical protein
MTDSHGIGRHVWWLEDSTSFVKMTLPLSSYRKTEENYGSISYHWQLK